MHILINLYDLLLLVIQVFDLAIYSIHVSYTFTPYLEHHISQSQASIQGDLINAQDLFMVDPWDHCHILGSLHRLTNRHTYRISPCASFTTDLEEQPRRYDVDPVHPRASRRPPCVARCPRCSTDLLTTYNYPPCLSTL